MSPSSRTHTRIWRVGWLLAAPLAFVAAWAGGAAAVVGVVYGYMLAQIIDPDLDQISITSAEARVLRRLWVLGAVFVGWSTAYAVLMRSVGGHRSPLSHWPIIGTAIRFVWFSPVILALPILSQSLAFGFVSVDATLRTCGGAFAALALADVLHWAADVMSRK